MRRGMAVVAALVLGAGLLVTPVAMADEADQEKIENYCASVGGLAEIIMKHRQLGTAQSEIRAIADDAFAKALIQMAYKLPRYMTERLRKTAIEDYRNEAETACYDAFDKH